MAEKQTQNHDNNTVLDVDVDVDVVRAVPANNKRKH